MNLFGWFEKWLIEHGSSAVLRDHNALLKSEKESLAAEKATLKSENEILKSQLGTCHAQARDLQAQLEVFRQEIEKLNSIRVALKEQTQLQSRIQKLEMMNADLERQLRVKNIGF